MSDYDVIKRQYRDVSRLLNDVLGDNVALRARIAKLEAAQATLQKEAAQWQESSGQNYVRAQEAEHLCDRADEIMARYKHEAEADEARIAELEAEIATLKEAARAVADIDCNWVERDGELLDVVEALRNALESGE